MRFVAAISTRFYGVYYAQSALVDTSEWTRKQILQFLDKGLIAPADISGVALEDAIGDVDLGDLGDVTDGGTTGQVLTKQADGSWAPSSAGAATPDATTTVKGKVKLAGDLAGTADAPTVPGLAGKENAGVAAAAVAAHVAAADPHPVYMTAAEDAAVMTAHVAAADPHAQYLLQSEGDARYAQTFAELNDVSLTGLANGYVMKWDTATSTWKPAADDAGSGGGGGASFPTGGTSGDYLRQTVSGGTPGPITTTGMIATANTEFGSGYEAVHAIDGSSGDSPWASANGVSPAILTLQLPTVHTVMQYGIRARSGPSRNQTVTSWKFQGSNDGSTWVDLDIQSGITWGVDNEEKLFAVASPQSYIDYRMYCTASATTIISINEIRLFEYVVPPGIVRYWDTLTMSDIADVDVSAAASDGQVLKWDATSSKWKRGTDVTGGGGGGGSGGSTLLLDTAPAVPHAKDDEFDGTSLDAKWSAATSDASNQAAVSVASGWVRIEPTATGNASTGRRGGFGIRQVAPTGSFTISAKVADGRAVDDARVGIFVASTSTGKGNIIGSNRSNSRIANVNGFTYSDTAEWSGYDGFDTFSSPLWPGLVWYRIRWDSATSTLFFDYSADGVFWINLTSRASMSQPNRMGLAIWANTANIVADHTLGAEWFRVTEP